jgi:hypothetical protein
MSNEPDTAPILISNLEVLELLSARVNERSTKPTRFSHRHRDWIEEQVVEYLKSTPCVRVESSRRRELQSILQSNKRTGTAVKRAGFALTEAESLQIVNCMPTEPVEIHLIIEELQSRMTERQQEELLALIRSYIKEDSPNAEEEVLGVVEEDSEMQEVVEEDSEMLDVIEEEVDINGSTDETQKTNGNQQSETTVGSVKVEDNMI